MNEFVQLVVIRLDEQRCALPLATVERSVRAVEVTPLPDAPRIVLGVIDVGGRILPVLNMRRRFRLPEREIRPVDQFVIAQTSTHTVALVVDETEGVIERPQSAVISPTQIVPGLDQIKGVIRLDDGMVLIHDLDGFLSLDELRTLDAAMSQEQAC